MVCAPISDDGIEIGSLLENKMFQIHYHYINFYKLNFLDFLNSTKIGSVKGVGGNGFTQMFYMTNYCWENMKHANVKDYNHSIKGT